MPPVHFFILIVQRGTIIQFVPAGIVPSASPWPGHALPMPMPGIPIPAPFHHHGTRHAKLLRRARFPRPDTVERKSDTRPSGILGWPVIIAKEFKACNEFTGSGQLFYPKNPYDSTRPSPSRLT